MYAKMLLIKKIGNETPKCISEGKDAYKRTLAECFINGESLSGFLVRSGYAFAYRKYSKKFIKDEEFAKENGAYFLLRNTHELKTKELEFDSEIEDSENLEEEIIKIYSEKNPSDFDKLIPQLMTAFSIQKEEGETTENFINRLFGESRKIMDI